jgi:uncharacterized membrane protein
VQKPRQRSARREEQAVRQDSGSATTLHSTLFARMSWKESPVTRSTFHDHLWRRHPAVRTGDQLTRGERAADHMKSALATWTALIGMGIFIACWMILNSHLSGTGHHFDPYPWILLNLCLSTLAGLQCFVLLIANRRGEQIAADLAQHTEDNTEAIQQLLTENTATTNAVHDLTLQVHEAVAVRCEGCGAPLKPGHHLAACPYCQGALDTAGAVS